MSDYTLYHGDCLEFMKSMPDKSVDAVVTDPPYGIDIAKQGTVGVEVQAKLKEYEASNWDKERPEKNTLMKYKGFQKSKLFLEVIISLIIYRLVSVGLFGIKKSLKTLQRLK